MAWGVFYRPQPTHYDCEHPIHPTLPHSHPPSQAPSYIKEYPPYNHPPHHHRRFVPTAPPDSNTHPPYPYSPALNPGTPRFKVPLSGTILEDPAFSSDPRTHPHFPLANAGSFKAPPPKSPHPPPYQSLQALPPPPRNTPVLQVKMPAPYGPPTGPLPSPLLSPSPSPSSASVFLDSDSHTTSSAFTSPTVSSATSYPSSPKQSHGGPVQVSAPVSPILLNIPSPPMSPKHAVISQSPSPLRGPEPPFTVCSAPSPPIPTQFDGVSISTKTNQLPLPRNKKNVPRKGRMKTLVRRLTNRHNLDRIDELDETDPFGGSYHHDGPYEAIGSNLAELGPPHKYHDIEVPRGNVHNSKHKLMAPSSRSVQYQSTPRVFYPNTEAGVSLHLEPGQILQQDTTYTPVVSGIGSIPAFFGRRQSNIPTMVTRPDHSRSQSLPKGLTRCREDPAFLDPPGGFKDQPSSASPRVPRIHYFGDNIPRIPKSLSSYYNHDHDAAPYALHQGETTSLPPPQHESAPPKSSSPQSAKVNPPVPPNPASQQTPVMDSAVSAFPPQGSRHRVTHSLDIPGTMNRTPAQSSSSTQDKPLEPPRIRHLPKRLVMPAPLQPQLPQLQYESPPVKSPVIYDEYLDDLSGSHFEGQPAMYNKGPRVLRKRSSAFPGNLPIPEHVPMPQGNAVPVIESSPTKADNEAERIQEGTRRRRLSKRKNDN